METWSDELQSFLGNVGNQVPRYSGFKTGLLTESDRFIELSPSVVFITNAWCYTLCEPQQKQLPTGFFIFTQAACTNFS